MMRHDYTRPGYCDSCQSHHPNMDDHWKLVHQKVCRIEFLDGGIPLVVTVHRQLDNRFHCPRCDFSYDVPDLLRVHAKSTCLGTAQPSVAASISDKPPTQTSIRPGSEHSLIPAIASESITREADLQTTVIRDIADLDEIEEIEVDYKLECDEEVASIETGIVPQSRDIEMAESSAILQDSFSHGALVYHEPPSDSRQIQGPRDVHATSTRRSSHEEPPTPIADNSLEVHSRRLSIQPSPHQPPASSRADSQCPDPAIHPTSDSLGEALASTPQSVQLGLAVEPKSEIDEPSLNSHPKGSGLYMGPHASKVSADVIEFLENVAPGSRSLARAFRKLGFRTGRHLDALCKSPKARQDILAILSGPEYHVSYADCLLLEQELDWRRERLESGN